jgi:hypothetical protein
MSNAGYKYIDRQNRNIEHGAWLNLLADEKYRIVREFDNGVVQIRLIWVGKLNRLQHSSFRDTWPVYEMRVMNYRANGTLAADPVEDGKTFPHEDAAVAAYEEFLVQWTECEFDDEDKFVEVDNHLAPPPPPDPDAPTSTAEEVKGLPDDLGAAW